MPDKQIATLAKKAGVSVKDAEKKWSQAKKEASSMGQGDNYAYIMSIFKVMIGLDENHSKDMDNFVNDFLKSNYSDIKLYREAVQGIGFVGDSSAPKGTTPTENPIAVYAIGDPDKTKKKMTKKDHEKHNYGKGEIGTSEVEKDALKLFKTKKSVNKKDKDPRSPQNTKKAIKDINKEDGIDAEVMKSKKESVKKDEDKFSKDGFLLDKNGEHFYVYNISTADVIVKQFMHKNINLTPIKDRTGWYYFKLSDKIEEIESGDFSGNVPERMADVNIPGKPKRKKDGSCVE